MNKNQNVIDDQDKIFNIDSSDEENDELYIGDTFFENGKKVELRVNWEYSCLGKYQPKKVLDPINHQNRQSKVTSCKWKVNGSMPEKILTITFTTVMNQYNYLMIPLA
ncbi:40313_t:CDS:2, partial [Gigaspora margarita]